MKEAVLPESDKFFTCPGSGPVLDYYAGAFSSVYVLFSPFLAPAPGSSMDRLPSDPEEDLDRTTIAANCSPVSWHTVAAQCGLPGMATLDIALRSLIGGLTPACANAYHAARVRHLCATQGWWPPAEGVHPKLLQKGVLSLFHELGHDWVWVGDEFGEARERYRIEDLKSGKEDPLGGPCNVFAPDKSLLWTVHWDSHFSFLCARSEAALKSLDIESKFEGFFCGPETEVYWSTTHTGIG